MTSVISLEVNIFSFLDSTEPTSFSLFEPSVAIPTGNESGIPPVLTTAEEQQAPSLFTPLPLKRKILFVNERVDHNKSPKSSWFNLFVLENIALPPPKIRKLDHEATVNIITIKSLEPNTSLIQISEDELTELKGGDMDSKQPDITLSNVSVSVSALEDNIVVLLEYTILLFKTIMFD